MIAPGSMGHASARSGDSVHRFERSRIVSAPPAARADHGLFKARTPARPEGASFGAVGITPAAPFVGSSCQIRLAGIRNRRIGQNVHKSRFPARERPLE